VKKELLNGLQKVYDRKNTASSEAKPTDINRTTSFKVLTGSISQVSHQTRDICRRSSKKLSKSALRRHNDQCDHNYRSELWFKKSSIRYEKLDAVFDSV
jgi:hypothetical protein